MKVLFFTPVFNYQDADIIKNHQYVRETSQHEIDYLIISKGSVEHNKQIAYREFLKGDYDYFFNVDADIMFLDHEDNPIDVLIKLAEQNKCLVGGIYVYKKTPALPTFRPLDLQKIYEEKGEFPKDYIFTIPKDPFEVEWLSGGCMMISREILAKLTAKYQVPNIPMIHNKEYLSEDFAFCKRTRDEGYMVLADPRIKLGHVGSYTYKIEDYKQI